MKNHLSMRNKILAIEVKLMKEEEESKILKQ